MYFSKPNKQHTGACLFIFNSIFVKHTFAWKINKFLHTISLTTLLLYSTFPGFAQKPVITTFTPSSGHIGTIVNFTGENFANVSSVYFYRGDRDTIPVTLTNTLSINNTDLRCVVFSPDGKYVAATDVGYKIKIWNRSNGNLVRTLTGHTFHINTIAYSADGNYLVSTGEDYNIKIWNTNDGSLVQTIFFSGYTFFTVAFSPDGNYVASGDIYGRIYIWRVSTGTSVKGIFAHSSTLSSLAYSPDGNTIVSGSWDNTVKTWSVSDGTNLHTFTGHTSRITSVTFSPDGNYIASASYDSTIRIWNANDGTLAATLLGENSHVNAVKYSSDGKYLISGGDDMNIRIWKTSDGSLLRTISAHSHYVKTVAICSDGNYIASGSLDGKLKLWNWNGDLSANFTVNSSTGLRATVPAGFKTGAIKLVNNYGTGTSSTDFSYVPNRPPVADTQTVSTGLNSWKDITLTGSDIDYDSLGFSIIVSPRHGDISGTTPNARYTPNFGYVGIDTLAFSVYDDEFYDTAQVFITITSTSTPPTVTNQSVTTPEDIPLGITLAVINPVEGDSLRYTIFHNSTNGDVSGTPPELTYTPHANFYGNDSLLYYVSTSAGSDTATVTITVTSVNDPPVTVDQSITTQEDIPVSILVTGSDVVEGSSVTFGIVTSPVHGTLSGEITALTYTPALNFNGDDSLQFYISDGNLLDTGTVRITVSPVNDKPVAVDQTLTTTADSSKLITFTATDAENSSLVYSILTPPLNGSISGTPPVITYTPDAVNPLSDSLVYQVSDGELYDTSTVTIIVILPYYVLQKPTITSFTPATGHPGTTVDIHGGNFTNVNNIYFSGGNRDTIPITITDTLLDHHNWVTAVTFSPDGVHFASTGYDQTIRIWNVNDGSLVRTISGGATYSIAYSPDGKYVVGGGTLETKMWKTDDGSLVWNLPVTGLYVNAVAFSPDGKYIVWANASGTLRECKISDHSIVRTWIGHTNGISSIAYSPGGQFLISGSSDTTVKIWNMNDGSLMKTLEGNGYSVHAVAYSPDGKSIASAGRFLGGNLKIWNASTGSVLFTLSTGSGECNAVTYSSDGNYLLAGGTTGFVKIFSTKTGTLVKSLTGHTGLLTTVAISSEGNYIGTGSFDNTARLWKWNGSLPASYTVVSPVRITATAPTGFTTGTIRVQNDYGVGVSDSVFTFIPNRTPLAGDQALSTNEDISLPFTVNATDADNDPLTFSILDSTRNGSITGMPPVFTYSPVANFHGNDSCTFLVSDGEFIDTGIIRITITSINDAPVAIDQSFTMNEDTSHQITLSGTDIENDTLTFSILDSAVHGTISGTPPVVTYIPNASYYGNDVFKFLVRDGSLNDTGTVNITVTPINDPPFAIDQLVTTGEDSLKQITLTANDVDNDNLTFSLLDSTRYGIITGTPPAIMYIPNANYFGSDSFKFLVADAQFTDTGIVAITITSINDAPVATNQSFTVNEDTSHQITLSGADVENDTLTFSILDSAAHGTMSGTPPVVTYTPNTNYYGNDVFKFFVRDSSLRDTGTVNITVTPINDAPVAINQSVTTEEDTRKPLTLIAFDVENDQLTFLILDSTRHGIITETPPIITYTPNANYFGSDSLKFVVADAQYRDTGMVSITVTPVNDAPVGFNQSIPMNEDTSVSITLTGSDIENDSLSFVVVVLPHFGNIVGTPPNLLYTPNSNYFGRDSLEFSVLDGMLENKAYIKIAIHNRNDAPVAVDFNVTTEEDSLLTITLEGSDVDNDRLLYTIHDSTMHGTLNGFPPNLTYTPSVDYYGNDSLTFTVTDGVLTDTGKGTIEITPGYEHTPLMLTGNLKSGWNLVSVPLNVSDYRKSTLYPNAISNAFSFISEGGYGIRETLKTGEGYWLKFTTQDSVQFAGLPIVSQHIHVVVGWNIIGSITSPIHIGRITSEPAGIINSQFFGYNKGYQSVDTLIPFEAYWVKIRQAGILIQNKATLIPKK